jgi:hypothetical protein
MTKEVTFEPADGPINGHIDHAYREKYRGSAYLNPMIGARARAATVKIAPRGTSRVSLDSANRPLGDPTCTLSCF